jgi:lipoate-protein ligase A
MAEATTVALIETEVEAVIRALENCGVNSGNYGTMLEHFRDPQLANAAKAVHGKLRSAGQRRTSRETVSGSTDVTRELNHADVITELRAQLAKCASNARYLDEQRSAMFKAIEKASEELESESPAAALETLRLAIENRQLDD